MSSTLHHRFIQRPRSGGDEVVRWRSWPLVDQPRWSWAVPVGMLAVGGGVAYLSGHWLAGGRGNRRFGGGAVAVFAAGDVRNLRRWDSAARVLVARDWCRGTRSVVSALSTGIVLYQRPDPTAVDALRSLYLPYPPDEDELLCAVREYLGHAVELP